MGRATVELLSDGCILITLHIAAVGGWSGPPGVRSPAGKGMKKFWLCKAQARYVQAVILLSRA